MLWLIDGLKNKHWEKRSMKKETKIINAGRKSQWTRGVVNPPIERASTVVFNSVKEMKLSLIHI